MAHSWRWGGGNAEGKVDEIVEEGKAEVTSNKVSFYAQFRSFKLGTHILQGKHHHTQRQGW